MKLLRASSVVCLVAWFLSFSAVAESVHYTIDPSRSFLTISGDFAGAPLVPQGPGTDSVSYFLALNGNLDGTSLALDTSHAASLFQSVALLPGRMDGDTDVSYGLKAQSPALGEVLVSTTRLSFYFSTQWRPPLDVADGTFQPGEVGFFLADGSFYYSTAAVPRQYVDLHGKGAPNRATAPGTLTRNGNLEMLTIPVATTFGVSTPDGNVTLSFAGQIVAIRILPTAVLRSSSPNLFGLSVASDSDTLLVGAPATEGTKGAVHLYYRVGNGLAEWREHQVLRPTYPIPVQFFGFALALDHNTAAIATYHSPVFIFERPPFSNVWSQTAVLETPDDTSFTGGNNLSLSEGVLAVGVNTAGSSEQGSVQIYERDAARAWQFVTTVQADDAEDGALFGSSVALLGQFMMVGAPGVANGSGAVYVFRREGANWRQLQKILPPQPIPNGEFGHSVATNIGQIIIAEPGDGQISDTPGRVYIYELKGIAHDDEWLLKHELIPNEPLPAKSRFGHRVGIDGNNRDVVVAQLRTAATPDTQQPGSAFVFTLGITGWPQRFKLAPTAHDYPSSFGISLGLASVHAVIGDYGSSTKPGAAYIYDLTLPQSPPVFIDAPEDLQVNAPAGQNSEVTLEATVADENGDDLFVHWLVDGSEVERDFVDGSVPFTRETVSLTTVLSQGIHQVRIVADERETTVETIHNFTVTVGDGEGPVIQSVTATPSTIPARGNRYVLVRLDVQATAASGPVTWKIKSVESSDAGGRGPRRDWIITPNQHSVRLRAGTDNRKIDRIYTVHVEARDGFGNVTKGQTKVTIVAGRPKLERAR
jgi:hypothetical protein